MDISELKHLEDEGYRTVASLVTDLLFEYDIAEKRMINRACRDGVFGEPIYIEQPRSTCRQYINPDDLDLFERFMADLENGKDKVYVEMRMIYRDGVERWTAFEGKTTYALEGKPIKVLGRIKRMEQSEHSHRTEHNLDRRDPLTKLLNRQSFDEILSLYYQDKLQEIAALLVIDLDDFKRVNEQMGQLFGDEIMAAVGRALYEWCKDHDTIARYGGDVFLISIRRVSGSDEIKSRCEEIEEILAGIYLGERNKRPLTASIGVAMYPQDGDEYDDLLQKAYAACRFAKKELRGYSVFWSEEVEKYSGGRNENREEGLRKEAERVLERLESYDRFGYELTELTFLLIEENADPTSTMNLLLHKLADHYDLSGICVRETTTHPYGTIITYEYLRKDYYVSKLGRERIERECDYYKLLSMYRDGYLYYNRNEAKEGDPIPLFESGGPLQTMIEIPLLSRGKVIGYIDYCDAYMDRVWSRKEIRTLKMFGRIVGNFLFQIRDYKETAIQIEDLREHDPLTGLLRYEVFLEKFQKLLSKPRDFKMILVYSDIRHFKYINEHYGLSTGDQLLKLFGQELLREENNLLSCRVFSDNIISVVRLAPSFPDEQIGKTIDKINELFSEKVRKRFYNGKLNINSGYYVIKDGDQAERSIANANMARKKAKETGNAGTSVRFEESMMEDVRRQIELTNYLPEAIRNRELKVYFQPKVECRSGCVIGAEALIRWQRPDGSFLYPDTFIPVFERNGSIVDLDYFVYREVFTWLKTRLDEGKKVVPVSVNVSRFHLRDNRLLDYLNSLYEEFQIPACLVEFELTENIYIENLKNVLPLVESLRTRGAKIAMDDFGSGFSSLNVLNELPIDVLKLDKVFMKKMQLDEGDKAVLTCVIDMAKKLHITVLCEGVENAEQDLFLCESGCDMIQGYFYGKPMPISEFERVMEHEFRTERKCTVFKFLNHLKDESGTCEAISLNGGITFGNGPAPGMGALCFPETASAAEGVVELPAQLLDSEDYTITFWAKEDTKRMWASVLSATYKDGFSCVMLHGWEKKALFRIKQTKDTEFCADAGHRKIPQNGWNFYTISYQAKNNSMNLYINGVSEGFFNPAPGLHEPVKFFLGGDCYQPGFHGKISELRVYPSILTILEINELYREYAYGIPEIN